MDTQKPTRRFRNLKVLLDKPMHASHKERISKKLKKIFALQPVISDGPMDVFRFYGQQIIRLELIKEANKDIMEATSSRFSCLQDWSQELWDLKEYTVSMIKFSEQMLRGLIAQGHPDGIYRESDFPDSKENKDTMTKSQISKHIAEETSIPVIDIPLSDCSIQDIIGEAKTTTQKDDAGHGGSTEEA